LYGEQVSFVCIKEAQYDEKSSVCAGHRYIHDSFHHMGLCFSYYVIKNHVGLEREWGGGGESEREYGIIWGSSCYVIKNHMGLFSSYFGLFITYINVTRLHVDQRDYIT